MGVTDAAITAVSRERLRAATAAAPAGRGALAALIDFAAALVVAVVCGILFTLIALVAGGQIVAWAVVGVAVGLLASVAAAVVAHRRAGRALGGLVLAVRTVDGGDLLPRSPRRRPGRPRSAGVAFDLRAGRDPLSRSVPAWPADAFAVAAPAAASAPPEFTFSTVPRRPDEAPLPPDTAAITFASGRTHRFTNTCVIGRNPSIAGDALRIAVPDLSRTLSKSHLSLTRTPDGVILRDLGSTNGTVVHFEQGGVLHAVAHTNVLLGAGDVVVIGDQEFRIDASGAGEPRGFAGDPAGPPPGPPLVPPPPGPPAGSPADATIRGRAW